MKQSNSQKFNLGLFVIISILILVVALYFVGNRQNLFGSTFRISAVFNNVSGLQLGNNVRYSGINVGTVKNIVMISDSVICVDMIIEEKMLWEYFQKHQAITDFLCLYLLAGFGFLIFS